MAEFRLPNINAPDPQGQMQQMMSYIRQLVPELEMSINGMEEKLSGPKEEAAEPFSVIQCYPVGSLYLSVTQTSPKTLFGGKWEQLKDRFLLAAGDTYLAGSVGGEAEVRLTLEHIPPHDHSYTAPAGTDGVVDGSDHSVVGDTMQATTGSAGGGKAHNNMPPYVAVYVWKRIA